MPSTAAEPLRGVLPIAPTPFHENGDLDLEGQRRVLDCMVDQGVDGICILANYSEQFLLTGRRARHPPRSLPLPCRRPRAGDRDLQPFLDPHRRRARAAGAAAAGAAMLMLMPPYHGAGCAPTRRASIEHFARVAEAAAIPIMVQDAPLSGVDLSVPFLARLAREVPQVRYFKIEVPGAAAKLRALIEAGGDAIVGPFDGEESITLMADLDAGATGTMPSALLPDLIRPVLEHHRAGRRKEAAAAYARILPLINFENRQCGLRATKTVMAEGRGHRQRRRAPSAGAAASGDPRGPARARPGARPDRVPRSDSEPPPCGRPSASGSRLVPPVNHIPRDHFRLEAKQWRVGQDRQ